MNLIYLRHGSPRTRKFIRKKLRRACDIQEGDCCLAPAGPGRGRYLVAFLNDISPEMLGFVVRGGGRSALNRN